MSVEHINDDVYFKNIYDNCFNQDVANEFYTYLLDFPAVNISRIPNTDLRTEMMLNSKSTPLKFLDDIKESAIYDVGMDVKASVVYDRYKQWCSDNGERNTLTSTKFGIVFSTKITKKRITAGNFYSF